ncbi:hypothetical protein B0H13DRAFT_1927727, partial [Mycena leptocephala]
LAHAFHHVLTEQYLAEKADEDEAELAAVEEKLHNNPAAEKTVSGRMNIAFLLNPVENPAMSPSIPTFLADGKPVSRNSLVEQRNKNCAETRVHSEAARKPQTDVRYLGGKFSLNHAAHQLKESIQQSEGLRTDTAFSEGTISPLDCDRGTQAVKGNYRYGSVSGKHERFHEAETVDGLSYFSLEVYEQVHNLHNSFQHIAPSEGRGSIDLALLTHAPISELVYNLATARMVAHGENGTYSLSGGDAGWERWRVLNARVMRQVLQLEARDDGEELTEDEDHYEEPEEGSKKRKPKPPRGGAPKKQRKAPVTKAGKANRAGKAMRGAGKAARGQGRRKKRKNSVGNFF